MTNEELLRRFDAEEYMGVLDEHAEGSGTPEETCAGLKRVFQRALSGLDWVANVENSILVGKIVFAIAYPENPIAKASLLRSLYARISDSPPEEFPIERGVGYFLQHVARAEGETSRGFAASAAENYLERKGVYPAQVIQEPLFE